jgi:hypothetical protein
MVGKRVRFDDATWQALTMLARTVMSFQEVADEAFADLLRKHDRPVDLKDALKRSAKYGAPDVEKPAGGAARGSAPLRMDAWNGVATSGIAWA